ncbi:MAG: GLPGLI family protein [Flavobacterium sp.]
MIKNIFFFGLILFAVVKAHSQQYSGTVLYKVALAEDYEYKPTDPLGKEIKEGKLASLAKQIFLLEFNDSNSRFIRSNSLSLDANNDEERYDKMANSYSSTYDYYLDNSLKLGMFRYASNGMLVKQNIKDKVWEISKESKKIGNYLCYKAVYLKSYMNWKGKNITIPVTAWFAPELPYRYGPKEYHSLPGLILELHESYGVFLATEVKIEKEKQFKFEFPKGKTISEEEYKEYQSSFIIGNR